MRGTPRMLGGDLSGDFTGVVWHEYVASRRPADARPHMSPSSAQVAAKPAVAHVAAVTRGPMRAPREKEVGQVAETRGMASSARPTLSSGMVGTMHALEATPMTPMPTRVSGMPCSGMAVATGPMRA